MKKIVLIVILIGAIAVRFYKIDNPIADWHSWRQADTSAVSRNFVKNGFDLFQPKYDDLSNVASGKENPKGHRLVEFPAYNFLQAVGFVAFPKISIEVWGRLINIFASVLTAYFIYLIVKKYVNETAGILAAFFFGFLPFSVYYGRAILPDTFMVMLAFSSLWFMSEFKDKNKIIYLSLSTIFFASALLVKPTAIFFGLPIGYLLVFSVGNGRDRSLQIKNIIKYIIVFSLSFLPLLFWRQYISRFPEGIPASSWLLNGDGIRFKGAWFRWIFGERIGKLILGYWGIVFLGFGIFSEKIKKNLVLEILGLSTLLYLIVFATGNVRHDYYQILIIPTIAIFCGVGLYRIFTSVFGVETHDHASLLTNTKTIGNLIIPTITIILLMFLTFALSWYEVKGFFNVNHPEIVEAGELVDRIVPWDAKVIAPYGGDTAFLYQTNRQGWPLLYDTNDVNVQVALGATHYVSTSFDEPTKKIMKECDVIFQNEKYVIVRLKCKV